MYKRTITRVKQMDRKMKGIQEGKHFMLQKLPSVLTSGSVIIKDQDTRQDEDFKKFAQLEKGKDRLPYIKHLETFNTMRALVTTQSMNYYLLKTSKHRNTVSNRLMDKKQVAVMFQLKQTALLCASSAVYHGRAE